MPLLRTETIFGNVCKFYDNGTVMVGTTAAKRFSVRLLATDDVPARLEAELKKRGLWSTGKLPEDEEATAEQLDDSELQAESGQPAAKPSVLFGSSRNALVLPRNERGLASDLGGAWELGQPLHRAEGEMHEISRAKGMLYLERCAAKEATKKRCLEEAALAADAKEPLLVHASWGQRPDARVTAADAGGPRPSGEQEVGNRSASHCVASRYASLYTTSLYTAHHRRAARRLAMWRRTCRTIRTRAAS